MRLKGLLIKILIVCAVFALLLGGSVIYLNRVYLPVKAKALIIDAIEKAIGREAALGAIKLDIFKGVVLDDLTIAGTDPKTEPVFLKVKQVSVGWLILPLKKQIIIPFVNAYSPELNLKRNTDNTFNIPVLTKATQLRQDISFVIYKINLRDARVNFSDEAVTPKYSKSVFFNLVLSFSPPDKIKYVFLGNVENPDKTAAVLEAKGGFGLRDKRLISLIKLENFNLLCLTPYLKGLPLRLDKGMIKKLSGSVEVKGEAAKLKFTADILSLAVGQGEINAYGDARLDASGVYNLKTNVFSDYAGSLTLGKADLSGLPYIKEAKDLSGEASFSGDKAVIANLNANVLGAQFNLSGEITDFKNPRLNLKISTESVLLEKVAQVLGENKIITLPVKIEGPAGLDLIIKGEVLRPEAFVVKGKAVLNNDKITVLDFKEEISGISGTLSFSKDKVEASNLQAAALGGQFKISGSLSNFKSPRINADISSDSVSLAKIQAFLIKNKLVDLPLTAEGDIGVAVSLDMLVSAPEKTTIKGEAALKGAKLGITGLKEEISGISGKAAFSNDAIEWKDLAAEFRKVKYNSSGKVFGFATPQINFDLSSEDLNLNAGCQWKDNFLAIREVKGKYLNSEFDASGGILFGKNAPSMDIQCDIALSLEDAKKIISDYSPENAAIFDTINAKGFCRGKLSASGKTDDPRGLTLSADLAAQALSVYLAGKQELKFENLRLNLAQKDRRISGFNLASEAYGGKLSLSGSADLAFTEPKFHLEFGLVNFDLAKLKLDTAFKDNDLSGILGANLILEGRGRDTKSFKGKGAIFVKDGNLWEFAPFQKLGQFLVIPSFEKIIFNEAQADLVIEEGGIFTDEGILKSPQINMLCYGKMDFSGNLDYMIKSEANKEVARDSSDLIQILSGALGQVSQFTAVKLTGTISKPKVSVTPAIFESLKQIKKEIFE